MQWVKPLYVCLTAGLFTQLSVWLKARARIRRIRLASCQGPWFDRLPFVYKRWCCERVQHCILHVKWICDLLAMVASVSVCCLLCFLTALMLSGEAVLLFASPLFVFQNWINYWWSKMKKMRRKKWRKKKKKREREKERESVLRIKCRTFFQFCFLTKDSRHLEPLRFISREHCPMMSESATYYQVLFCR